jgi:hypothetical protein
MFQAPAAGGSTNKRQKFGVDISIRKNHAEPLRSQSRENINSETALLEVIQSPIDAACFSATPSNDDQILPQ